MIQSITLPELTEALEANSLDKAEADRAAKWLFFWVETIRHPEADPVRVFLNWMESMNRNASNSQRGSV